MRAQSTIPIDSLHIPLLAACLLLLVCGCGATKSSVATDQLLMSDAVDATVAQLDFSPLASRRVYLDVSFLKTQKTSILVDSDYAISSLRQQMMSDGVLLVETREEADLIAEARMGALGIDGHNVVYGLPASNVLSSASNALTGSSMIPSIPELSVARREAKSGAAKLAVFAYDRQTRQPYWQSGIARSASNARDTWFLGIGPWQSGTIYNGTRFAGSKFTPPIEVPSIAQPEDELESKYEMHDAEALASYKEERVFVPTLLPESESSLPEVVPASRARER